MTKEIKNKSTVAKAAAVGGLVIVSALGGAAIMDLTTEPVVLTETQFVNQTVEVPVEVIKEVPVNVTVEKVVEVQVEDTEFLKLVCDRALFDDLMECKEEITAEDVALKLAIEKIEKDFARELYRADLITDDRRADLIRVYDDFDKIEVVVSNFDRDKYEFVIETRVEDDRTRDRSDFAFTVTVDNGEAKIVSVE